VTNPPLPDVWQLFARFDSDAGSDGAARDRFQTFVTDLVKAKYPDASTVEGPGNRDWGIDTFCGELAGGILRIWQSKYILEWQDKSPQSQVRSSFQSAVKNAVEHEYKITAWTLVVPCKLAPDQMKWFNGWAKKESGRTGIVIDLWDGTELRHQLMTQDALHVRREYFPHTLASIMTPAAPAFEPVAGIEDLSQFEGALFVRQLQEAGHVETDSACAHFFATDALVRDYESRGQKNALAAMAELHLEVRDVWELRFNDQTSQADSAGRMQGLVRSVVDEAAQCPDPPGLHLARAHKKGTVHRLVEQSKAGWVIHWRDVAAAHDAQGLEAMAAPVVDAAQPAILGEVLEPS
jgi:hypothetical protein